MIDKKLLEPLSLEDAEIIAKKMGYTSLSSLFEESGLGTRSKITRMKAGGSGVMLGALLRMLVSYQGLLKDPSGEPIQFAELLARQSLIEFTIRDGFAAPAYRAGDIILAEPYNGSIPVDGEWIVRYQGKEVFGRLMVLPDGAWRFSRTGGGTEPILFGPEHKDIVSLVGRALYHINKIGV
jgi:hypothetical protein